MPNPYEQYLKPNPYAQYAQPDTPDSMDIAPAPVPPPKPEVPSLPFFEGFRRNIISPVMNEIMAIEQGTSPLNTERHSGTIYERPRLGEVLQSDGGPLYIDVEGKAHLVDPQKEVVLLDENGSLAAYPRSVQTPEGRDVSFDEGALLRMGRLLSFGAMTTPIGSNKGPAPKPVGNLDDAAAVRRLAKANNLDDVSTTTLRRRAAVGGADTALADIMGPVGRGTGETIAQTPGPGQSIAERFLAKRASKTADALGEIVSNKVSAGDFAETVSAVRSTRAANAKPLYEAFSRMGDVGNDEIVSLIGKSKRIKAAINEAKGYARFSELPDTHADVLDQAYKNLGGKARAAYRSGDNVLFDNLNSERELLREAIVKRAPVYGEALNEFSESSALLDALDMGRDFALGTKQGRTITDKMIRSLPAGEREMFALGSADGIQQLIDTATSPKTMVNRLSGSKTVQKRIRLLFPEGSEGDQQFRSFMREVKARGAFQETAKTMLGGSPTARRLAQEAFQTNPFGIAVEGLGTVSDVASANPMRIMQRIDSWVKRRNLPPEQSRALAKMIFTSDRAELNRVLDALDILANNAPPANVLDGGATAAPATAAAASNLALPTANGQLQ